MRNLLDKATVWILFNLPLWILTFILTISCLYIVTFYNFHSILTILLGIPFGVGYMHAYTEWISPLYKDYLIAKGNEKCKD